MSAIRRIVEIEKIEGYKVFCKFDNRELKVIDFQELFNSWNVKEGDFEYPLMQSLETFQAVKVIDGTLTWENIKIESTDEYGKPVIHPLDFDPIVIYEAAQP